MRKHLWALLGLGCVALTALGAGCKETPPPDASSSAAQEKMDSGTWIRHLDVRYRLPHANLADYVAWSADGTRIASLDTPTGVYVWDAHTRRKLFEISTGGLFPSLAFLEGGDL